MNRLKLLAASALISLSLAACGGGSGGSAIDSGTNGDTNGATTTTTHTVISGMATKGPITGTVSIYALNAGGAKGNLLKSATVDNGNYSADIGDYAGPVVIEVTGSYTDEATGKTLTIPTDAPMRAALSNAAGTVSVAVTPLTELAVQKAGTLTASAIDAGNKLVSDIFKFDIIKTLPIAPTAAAFGSATQSQKTYTLALAGLSQLSQTRGEPLSATLTNLASGITSTGMNSDTVTSFQDALTTFIMTNLNNATGVNDLSATGLAAINGGISAHFTLALEGTIAANAIKGLQFEIVIPAGLTVRSNAATASTSIAAAQPLIVSIFSPANNVLSLGIITKTGIGSGNLETLTCDTVPGFSIPPATAFNVRNIKAVDGSGATISGVNVTVN